MAPIFSHDWFHLVWRGINTKLSWKGMKKLQNGISITPQVKEFRHYQRSDGLVFEILLSMALYLVRAALCLVTCGHNALNYRWALATAPVAVHFMVSWQSFISTIRRWTLANRQCSYKPRTITQNGACRPICWRRNLTIGQELAASQAGLVLVSHQIHLHATMTCFERSNNAFLLGPVPACSSTRRSFLVRIRSGN